MRRPLGLIVGLLVGLFASPASAQTPSDTLRGRLPEARVEAIRSTTEGRTAPFSVTVRRVSDSERRVDAGVSLGSALRQVPGVYLSNRENPALGERLVVRGMGARSAFGVRGVQVLLDGIPLTQPDGQAVLTIVDPAVIRSIEAIRGPASTLWGNGSGGTLYLSTIPSGDLSPLQFRALAGTDGLRRAEAEAGHTLLGGRAGLAVSHTRSEGYRAYSSFVSTRARLFGEWTPTPTSVLRTVVAFEDTPRQQHPGALTAAELENDAQQAEARYVTTRSGKRSRQLQGGLTWYQQSVVGLWTTTLYGQTRHLDNPLPFAYIDLDRRSGGIRTMVEQSRPSFRWALGADAAVQRDDRRNAPNEKGVRGTPNTLNQIETVRQAALFGRIGLDAAPFGLPQLSAEAAVRADNITFDAADHLLGDGDQSGTRTLGAVSPAFGLVYQLPHTEVYVSLATAFETPTTTELANRPDGLGGFNVDLDPQRSTGFEVGTRGQRGSLTFDAVVFVLQVRDGFAPYQGDDGRTFYRNAQRTEHRGAELSVAFTQPRWQMAVTYTGLHARFSSSSLDAEGAGIGGNTLPGVPPHRLTADLSLRRGGWALGLSALVLDAQYADDANTARTTPLALFDVHLSKTSGRLLPFVRVDNALGTSGAGSVVLNARGGRYFEPVAGRQVLAGVQVTW